MSINYFQEDSGFLVYENTTSGKFVRVYDGDLASAVGVCELWHGGQNSPCYRLMSNDFSFRNLQRVRDELRQAQQEADASDANIDEDDYIDLLTTIDDLEGILRRIEKIR